MVDERILEILDSEREFAGPKDLDEDPRIEYHYEYIRRRLQLLSKTDLVERVGRGVYRISDDGRAYLYGELDLSDTSKPD